MNFFAIVKFRVTDWLIFALKVYRNKININIIVNFNILQGFKRKYYYYLLFHILECFSMAP